LLLLLPLLPLLPLSPRLRVAVSIQVPCSGAQTREFFLHRPCAA